VTAAAHKVNPPGLDPDRASFTTAVQTARDQLITTHGIDPDPATATDRLGAIGQAVLATPAASAAVALQQPQRQMHHLALPRPRRRAPHAFD
jgi:hypothetical protein